jgi:large subunit ribosomal protein L7/L12
MPVATTLPLGPGAFERKEVPMNARNWSADIKALGDRVALLSAARAAELSDYLEFVHGVRTLAPSVVIDDRDEKPEPEDGPPEPTAFRVALEGYDPAKRVGVIKAVRDHTGLGLKEARDAVDAAPRVIREGLSRAEAEALKVRLEEVGCRVSIQPVTP